MKNCITFELARTEHTIFSCEHNKSVESYSFKLDEEPLVDIDLSEFCLYDSFSIIKDIFRIPCFEHAYQNIDKIDLTAVHLLEFRNIRSNGFDDHLLDLLNICVASTTFKDIKHLCFHFLPKQQNKNTHDSCTRFLSRNNLVILYDTPNKIIATNNKFLMDCLNEQPNHV
jgi:hypothetical protein